MESDAVIVIWIFGAFIALLMFGPFIVGIIWAIFARVQQKKTERFEKRDN